MLIEKESKLQSFRRITALAVALALPMPPLPIAAAGEAPPVSLPQLLEEVRRVNPDLLAARKRWEAAQARIPQSVGLPPPKIGVQFEDIPRGTIKLNQATIIYQLLQSLPFPGKLSLRHQVAVKEAQESGMRFKQAELNITSDLKQAYYDLFLLDRELEIEREQRLWTEQAVAAAQTRYATGISSQAELLKFQGEALTASNAIEVLDQRRQAMVAHLNHLLNRPSHHDVGRPGPIPLAWIPFTPDELLLIALEQQPELLAFKYAAERADASWRLAKRELLPDLETMLELRDPAMGPIGPWDLSLAIVLPFWFWTKLRYGVRVALYDKESAQAAYAAMRNEIEKRIHEHWHEAFASYLTAKLGETGLLPLKRQAVSSAMAAYQGGRGTSLELVEALRELAEQKRSYNRDLVSLEQHVVMLEQAVGISLRESNAASAAGGTS